MPEQPVNEGVPNEIITCIIQCLLAVQDGKSREQAIVCLADPRFDWKRFLRVVQRNRVGAILYQSASKAGLSLASVTETLHYTSLLNAWRNSILLNELENLLELFRAHELPVVVLKGAALLLAMYDNVGMRQVGDIDLLVPVQNLDRTYTLLLSQGYSRVGLSPWLPAEYLREVTLSKMVASFPVTIDLHGSITSPPHHLSRHQKEWFLTNTTLIEKDRMQVRVLKPEAQLLHLCWHLFHHYGGDLQWQFDIHELIRVNEHTLDWVEVLRVGQAFNLLVPLQRVLPQLSAAWKTPVTENTLRILAEMSPSQREQRIYHVPYGRESGRTWMRLWLELTGFDSWRERFGYFWYRLFPNYEFMKENYGVRTRWLLPLSYLYRWGVSLLRKHQEIQ